MTTFTGTGISAAQTVSNPGSITITLTNTSSFIGTVFMEGSPSGGANWTRASQSLLGPGSGNGSGTGSWTSFTVDIPTPLVGMQIRLNCTQYTSGTLTYSFTLPQSNHPAVGSPGSFPNCVQLGNAVTISTGIGAPSAIEPNGSLYLRQDGGSNTRLYVSEGAGTWAAISSS